jgi:hypothetical protein
MKRSDIFNDIEQLISEMTETIGKLRQNREINSSAVIEQKIKIENDIREVRTQINNHLDKLQEDLLNVLTEAEIKITEETREVSVISLINCSISLNISDLFISLIIFSRIATSEQSI